MQEIVAPTDIKFDVEVAIEEQLGAVPLPFHGMDKTGAPVCRFYRDGQCDKGPLCPYRHVKGEKSIVCKHWLRGLCKKGDECEFLHEYDLTKMPECFFYAKFNSCSNKECPFLHIDPASKIKDCPWYDRGFCRHGPNCKNRHTRRVMCLNFLNGFCPEGSDCKKAHARFDIPVADPAAAKSKPFNIICHHCGEPGHKIYTCPNMNEEERERVIAEHFEKQQLSAMSGATTFQPRFPGAFSNNIPPPQQPGDSREGAAHHHPPRPMAPRRPLEEVTCFKCGDKGHFANKCPKGHLAFLSPALQA